MPNGVHPIHNYIPARVDQYFQDGPLITRFAQLDHPLETRLVQAPLVTRLVQGGPAFARVVPANPAVTTVVQVSKNAQWQIEKSLRYGKLIVCKMWTIST